MKNRYSLTYFLGQAIRGLWRNGVMSVASVAVLMSCLIVLGCFGLLVINIDVNLDKIAELNEIVAYCEDDMTEDEIVAVEGKINTLGNVASCTRVTKAQALEQMKSESGDPELYSDITEENNPLSDSFEIIYENLDENAVFNLEAELRAVDGIKKVNSAYKTAKTVDNLKSGVMLVFIWFLVILFVVSLFVIINTIKLAVFSRRSEISVMRYVGATNWFITLPFIFEGVLIGFLASLLGFVCQSYIYIYIEKMVATDMQMLSMIHYPQLWLQLLAAFIIIGIFTGIIGSVASLRKYLKS